MDALETILRPVVRLVNRQVREKTPARELCQRLQGQTVAVQVRGTALALYFTVGAAGISAAGKTDGEPDVVISGSLITLAGLAGKSGEAAVREGKLEIIGDAAVARDFQKLMQYGRPDLEEELSGVIGDGAAHGLGRLVRDLTAWGRQTGETFRQNVSEYLQEESRDVPTRYEADVFRREVETIRDDVERFEARLRRLEITAGSGN